MKAFLRPAADAPEVQALYDGLDERWNGAPRNSINAAADAGLPVRWPTCRRSGPCSTPQPSRYNWMLQFYLRAEGLALSWVGTGRLIFSLNYTTPTSTRCRSASWPRPRDAGRRLVVARRRADQRSPSGAACCARCCCASAVRPGCGRARANASGKARRACMHRVHALAAQQMQRRAPVEQMSWKGSVRILVIHTRPVCRSCRQPQLERAEQQPGHAERQPGMPTSCTKSAQRGGRLDQAEQRRRSHSTSGSGPDGDQHRPCGAGCSRP
jgi:hypothetical protein